MKPGRVSKSWKWGLAAAAIAVCSVAVAVVIVYSVRGHKKRSNERVEYKADWGSSSNSEAGQLIQLPAPESPEADALLARSDTPSWITDLYTHQRDSALVTAELTAAWLQLLQMDLLKGHGSADHLDLQPFIRVAADILGYLRYNRSKVLLQLLREFAATGSVEIESVDPDVLQVELQTLFSVQNLNTYYLATVRSESTSHASPSPAATAATTPTQQQPGRRLRATAAAMRRLQQRQQRRWLLQLGHGMPNFEIAPLLKQLFDTMRSTDGASVAAQPFGGNVSQNGTAALFVDAGSSSRIAVAPAPSRGAEAAAASTAAVASQTGTAAIGTSATGTAVAQTLQDMICAAASFNPSGLTGVLSNPSVCSEQQHPKYNRGDITFTPVKVPVAFHVLRFLADIPAYNFRSTDMPQAPFGNTTRAAAFPPLWSENANSKAGQNLIDVSNLLFRDTGIQFALKEVRTDAAKYPYLVQPSKDAWLNCTHNALATAQGMACLEALAAHADVAPLVTQDYVINVFVSGSDGKTDPTYCARTAARPNPSCASTSEGYTAAQGPWFLRHANPAWSEQNPTANWIFLSWENFDIRGSNAVGRWNGGAATLAHELGHYLGLLHTHEGSPACLNGPMTGDAVLDTPANVEIGDWMLPGGVADLAGWCSDFRHGKQPQASQLAKYHSCSEQWADNVFNVMSYIPDSCVMIFTPGQAARMQWAIAKYRPQMMRAHASV